MTSHPVTRADRARAVARALQRVRAEGGGLRITIGQRAHIVGVSVAELRRRDIPSDPNPFPRLRLIGRSVARTGVRRAWLVLRGHVPAASEWEDA